MDLGGKVARRWRNGCVGALFLILVPFGAVGAQGEWAGDWLLALKRDGAVDYGTLTFEKSGDGLTAYVDGGPVTILNRDAGEITVTMDWTDSGDRLHEAVLTGQLKDGMLSGRISEEGEKVGAWQAAREAERSRILKKADFPPGVISLPGTWSVGSRGTHKDRFDLTQEGKAKNKAYDPTFDDPHLRCVAGGLIRILDGPFPIEIIRREDHFLFLFQYFGELQRIYMDGRDFPDDVQSMDAPMGYSIGRWEESTLVVETRGLKKAVWDARGMPISSEARVVQRLYLDTHGNLHNEITLHDPINYERPVLRHAYWEYTPDAKLQEYSCDPHAFYRAMDIESRLQEYWTRSKTRR